MTRRFITKSRPILLPPPVNDLRPDALFISLLCLLSGVTLLISGAVPGSIESQLPDPFIFAWALSLSLGGLLMFAAIFIPDRITSLLVERIGRLLLGGMCIVYGTAVLLAFAETGFFAASLAVALGLSSAWRIVQISILIRSVHVKAQTIDDDQ